MPRRNLKLPVAIDTERPLAHKPERVVFHRYHREQGKTHHLLADQEGRQSVVCSV